MATLSRGTTITVSDTVTAATLHTLIEAATISGLSGGDIGGGGVFFTAATTSTPNHSLSPFWFDISQEDPIYRVFAAPWNIWLAVGPDRFEIPLKNSASTDALKGALVIASGASDFTLGANPSLNAIGFLQSLTAPGAFGPVATMGVCWALYASGHSGTTEAAEGRALVARGTPAGTCCSMEIASNNGSGPMFGQWLETDRSGFSGSYSIKRAFVWGPKLTTGF